MFYQKNRADKTQFRYKPKIMQQKNITLAITSNLSLPVYKNVFQKPTSHWMLLNDVDLSCHDSLVSRVRKK